MPKAVVHIFETIKIQVQQCKFLVASMRYLDHVFKVFIKIRAAGETGQFIRVGKLPYAILRLGLLSSSFC